MVTIGSLTATIGVLLMDSAAATKWVVCAGALIAQGSVLFLRGGRQESSGDADLDATRNRLDEDRLTFDNWREAQTDVLRQQSVRIEERNRDLLERHARYQEFAEYPTSDIFRTADDSALLRLSEQDREVSALLEEEAERVYEKIRRNGYTSNGVVDLGQIRDEVLGLIRRVARIYSPDSDNPILETSFEQLARSVSRICLQSLVLLEQLPLDVKRYNINELHSYLRKAVQGYGAYQQVAPWLKRISRGAYAGRLVAGSNPIALGAWWLATELGRHGTRKLVENVVDRQAVAVLHDVITVIGTEVANVYGHGYRQRDVAWVYGTELVEMVSRFPVSRDSLGEALREITALPLRSEYDRVYLYRCVAGHQAAGLRIEDPAVLPRTSREDIAKRLESFYESHIHGQTPELQQAWQNDVEARLDVKLHMNVTQKPDSMAKASEDAVRAVHSFLVSVLEIPSVQAASAVESCDLMAAVPLERRAPFLADLSNASTSIRFEPPDLDPSSELVTLFLESLMVCVIRSERCDPHIEELLLETAGYFRRTRADAHLLMDACSQSELKQRAASPQDLPRLSGPAARCILRELRPQEEIVSAYNDVSVLPKGCMAAGDGLVLAVVQNQQAEQKGRMVLLQSGSEDSVLWRGDANVQIHRRKGIFIDDCELTGGNWRASSSPPPSGILISGSMSGGGYRRYFTPLLCLQQPPESTSSTQSND